MMLLLTGISLLGVIAALAVAALLLVFGGLFVLVIKLLPWLALAIVVVWLYRALQKNSRVAIRRDVLRRVGSMPCLLLAVNGYDLSMRRASALVILSRVTGSQQVKHFHYGRKQSQQ